MELSNDSRIWYQPLTSSYSLLSAKRPLYSVPAWISSSLASSVPVVAKAHQASLDVLSAGARRSSKEAIKLSIFAGEISGGRARQRDCDGCRGRSRRATGLYRRWKTARTWGDHPSLQPQAQRRRRAQYQPTQQTGKRSRPPRDRQTSIRSAGTAPEHLCL